MVVVDVLLAGQVCPIGMWWFCSITVVCYELVVYLNCGLVFWCWVKLGVVPVNKYRDGMRRY
jgi:hypothetical protein